MSSLLIYLFSCCLAWYIPRHFIYLNFPIAFILHSSWSTATVVPLLRNNATVPFLTLLFNVLSVILRGVYKKFVHSVHQKSKLNYSGTGMWSPSKYSPPDRMHLLQRFSHSWKQCCVSSFVSSFRSFVVSRLMVSTSTKCSPRIIFFTLGNR